MAAGDASAFGRKGVAYRVTFPILDADGDLVTGATGLDSEVSKDGGTFADCTNEATEIATSSGVYYLDLTATEMNADTVAVIVKTTSSGAKTTTLVIYPLKDGDITANATQWGGVAVTGMPMPTYTQPTGFLAATFPATVSSLTAGGVRTELATELGRIDVTLSTRLATSSYTTPPTAAANATAVRTELTTELGRIDATVSSRLAGTAYTAAPTSAANATAVWDSLLSAHTTAGTFGGRLPRSDSSNVEVKLTGSAHIAADVHETQPGSIHAETFDPGAIDAAALASDAVTEITTSVLTTAMTESYRATGAAPTLAQTMFELIAHMGEASISGTTKTLKKLDGMTTAKTYTLDSSTTPTSITETT
jgi:hypothetical protein